MGEDTPNGTQRLLNGSVWDVEGVRQAMVKMGGGGIGQSRRRAALDQLPKNDADDRLLRIVGLSIPEIRRLLVRLVWTVQALPEPILAWSFWHRRKQARAKIAHYRHRQSVLSLYLRL